MASESENRLEAAPDSIEMPAPTAWPFVMAVGITLIASGVVTNFALTGLGILIFLIAASGWAWLVFGSAENLEQMPIAPPEQRPQPVQPSAGSVEALAAGMPGHRLTLPEKMHPYSAGAKGGLVGAFTMTIPALFYGLTSKVGIWYPINLLAGMVMPLPRLSNGALDVESLGQFRFVWLAVGTLIHFTISVSLGLVYGVLLPMLPRRPIIWGGLVAPLLWTGGIYGFMGVLNPALSEAVNWPSFAVAQFVYGLTVGIVVVRSEQVYTNQ